MDRFIWIGQECVNLDCVIRFRLQDEGKRIVVQLRDVPPDEKVLSVDGDDAERLLEVLHTVELGAKKEAIRVTVSMPNIPQVDEIKTVTIGSDMRPAR